MKKRIFFINIIILIIIFIFFIFTLSGFKSNGEILDDKANEEIKYMENKIVNMMNKMNNITFSNYVLEKTSRSSNENVQENTEKSGSSDSNSSDSSQSSNNSENTLQSNIKYELKNNSILTKNNTQIDWEYLKSDIEAINLEWSNVIIDLHQLNIKNEDILSFSNILDQTIINIKEENKVNSLINLANLYAYLPNYLEQFSDNQEQISIAYIKSNILNSYALVEQDRWDEVKTEITTAIENVTTMMNSVNTSTNIQNKISKIYVILNELNNTINLKDKDLYYIKYKNLMEELVNF